MNSVYFPAHVVLVLRRIVNVISTLTVSNQYILLKQAKADEQRLGIPTDIPTRPGDVGWTSRNNWQWLPLVRSETSTLNANSSLFGRPWSWPALLSTFTQVEDPRPIHISDPPPPPPKPHKNDRRPETRTRLPPPDPPPPSPLPDIIHQLIRNPALHDPVRTPRYPIVLCHGLYGFDSRGPLKFPSMRMHYWSNVLKVLRDTVGAEVIVTSVPGTGSITSRAAMMDRQLQHKAHGRGINFLAHSMGGLDCRHLITRIKPELYAPLSLTTVSTPHRGSPFMDWCAEYLGLGKLGQQEQDPMKLPTSEPQPRTTPAEVTKTKADATFTLSLSSLPSSFTALLLSIVDSPAYANLTSNYLNEVFNPSTPDDPTVKYFSVAGRMAGVSIWHPFWFTKMVLDGAEEKHRGKLKATWDHDDISGNSIPAPLWAQEREWGNDGLVTVQSAKWGEFLGIMEGCDHWEMRGARGIEFGVDLPAIPVIGLGGSTADRTSTGDGWGLPEWARFVGAWKKDQKAQADAVSRVEGLINSETELSVDREQERKQERERDEAIIKSSTDKLSAVLDWLTEQVPSTPLVGVGGRSKGVLDAKARIPEPSLIQKRMEQEGKSRMKNELASKNDLERFYVALSRKLYDEGL